MKAILTYSALNCFRNCPRKYKLRYLDNLRRPESPEALAFGDVIHNCLEQWYTLPADSHRLLAILDLLDAKYPNRAGDAAQKAAWQLARAIMAGYAARYAEEEFEVLHDLDHGKGWAFVKNEWHRVLTRLASLPYGLILISHAVDKQVKTRTEEYTKVQPSLPDRARGVVLGLVDMILYCDAVSRKGKDGQLVVERVIRTKPSPAYEAGDRTGRLPEMLPLDFDAFLKAFSTGQNRTDTQPATTTAKEQK